MRARAYVWPAILIAVGLLALLVNLGAIPTDRLYRIADLWPLLLIILGLELLINRARLPSTIDVTASVLVVVLAVVGAAAYVALGPPISSSTRTMTASAPAGDLTQATLEVDVGASTLHVVGSTSLGNDLFQTQITYSGPQPSVSLDQNSGRVVVSQNGRFGYFGRESIDVSIQLNAAVAWTFAIHSGASRDTYDLSNVNLAGLEIATGASTDEITLPQPHGIVPVRINGGALSVRLHRPNGAAASVKVSGGAVSLSFDGDRSSAIGAVSHSTAEAADMLNVSVNGGTCNVSMDQVSGPD